MQCKQPFRSIKYTVVPLQKKLKQTETTFQSLTDITMSHRKGSRRRSSIKKEPDDADDEADVVPEKRRGRPVGSKNGVRSASSTRRASSTKRTAGRPKGSKNKKGIKYKAPSKIDLIEHYMHDFGTPAGHGTIVDLLEILNEAFAKGWNDERVLEYFGPESTQESQDDLENDCHFYFSSKGCLVAEGHALHKCLLFPGVKLTTHLLERHIHTPDDVQTYGVYVSRRIAQLRKRAQALANNKR